MGIHKLMDLIREKAPQAVRTRDITYYSGMWIALDASMAMYQFIISVQGHDNTFLSQLTDKDGNKTGHLLGLFNRTIGLIDAGVKPVWVFDGQAPKNKDGQILRRKKLKEEAQEKADLAKEEGQLDQALKQQQRTTRITRQQKEDAIKMLQLMGVPVILAPGEAEAQCSYMCKSGIVDAVGTEDMDALTFGATLLLRDLNHKKEPITQINRKTILQGFEMSQQQFIDLCILCGCDYASRIGGIGPVKAFKLIQEHSRLQSVMEHLNKQNSQCKQDNKKFGIPSEKDFCYVQARQLFKHPKVVQTEKPVWNPKNIKEEELTAFLVNQKAFSQERVKKAIEKIKSSNKKGTQPRLEAFFGKPTVLKSTIVDQSDKKSKKRGGKR